MPANPQQPGAPQGQAGGPPAGGEEGKAPAGEAQASPPKSPEKKGGDKGNKKKSKKKSSKESGGGRVHVDILGETAMRNALFICHSVQELLFWRGYQWAPGGKKQKGKKGKK
ncbi:small lysine-rich protein 1 [Penaeus vannamei]|uniref:small lysine-rich protein 1 n=1 Tax=Penaeus vannamei TaxID=6689 RepID=UPI00387F431C